MADNPKFSGYFKLVTPKPTGTEMTDNQSLGDAGLYGNYTWYQRLVQGSASRTQRYREYDMMDNDVEIARALDTIAEEMTGNNPKSDQPLELDMTIDEEQQNSNTVQTLQTALQHWCRLHDWENKLFHAARYTIKYGDIFFKKEDDTKQWKYIHPQNVVSAIVAEDDITHVLGWQIRKDVREAKSSSLVGKVSTGTEQYETEFISADNIVRFTLNDDMSEQAPFGNSILQPVYRAHKQKELLEDSIIIYRVQRAPERRVFYVDVGKMPPQRVKQHLEQIKNEIKQKKVPSQTGGQDQVDSVYNPQSMSEDFFFAQRADGRGSSVETLPGGQGLGELTDLEYFQNKVFRGLRVPVSYMQQGSESAIFNDGKVGVAYIEELRFALYVMRLQGHIEQVLDQEFKRYLRKTNINIDETSYRIRLPEPSNFGTYRQQELDATLLGSFGSADGVEYLSKRFILKRYLQLTDDEIIKNEEMLREEKGMTEDEENDLPQLYGQMEEGEMGGEMGGADLGGAEIGMEAGDEDLGEEELEGEEAAGGEEEEPAGGAGE